MEKAVGLEYEVVGDGDPLLLIHGSILADGIRPLTREPALADHYRLIHYHRRGFAGSDPAPDGFEIQDQARDAAALLEHLGVGRAHVVGHSFGAVTATQLTMDAPDLVHSLTLLEPPKMASQAEDPQGEIVGPAVEAYQSGDELRALDLFMSGIGGADWRAKAAKTVPGGPEQAEEDVKTFFDVEAPAVARWDFSSAPSDRITQPTLFVIGTESGPAFEAPRQLFVEAVPGTEEAVLPGLNHMLQQLDPPLVAKTIADFVGRHPM